MLKLRLVVLAAALLLAAAASTAHAEPQFDLTQACQVCQTLTTQVEKIPMQLVSMAEPALRSFCSSALPNDYVNDCLGMVEGVMSKIREQMAAHPEATTLKALNLSQVCTALRLCKDESELESARLAPLVALVAPSPQETDMVTGDMEPVCFHISQIPGNPKFCSIIQEKPAGILHSKIYHKTTFGKLVLASVDTDKASVCSGNAPPEMCRDTQLPGGFLHACSKTNNKSGTIHGSFYAKISVAGMSYDYHFLKDQSTNIRC